MAQKLQKMGPNFTTQSHPSEPSAATYALEQWRKTIIDIPLILQHQQNTL